MTIPKRSSVPEQSAIYDDSTRMISPPPLYRSDTPSVASSSPLVTPTASTTISASGEDTVKVTVRCRPPSKTEIAKKSESCWDIDSENSRISLTDEWAAKPGKVRKDFLYDHVYYGSDNCLLYEHSVRPVIQSTMDGYNGTVFAYGQTASGKTYIGKYECWSGVIFIAFMIQFLNEHKSCLGTEEEQGVIPRAVNDVFAIISETTEKEYLLRVSYLEIYNETLRDLLSPESEDLRIHEDKKRGVYVSSLKEEIVTSPKQVMKVIQRGEENRHVSSTDFNLHSSRSHTVFQMIVESREREPGSMPSSPTSQKHKSFLRGADYKRSVQVSQLVSIAINLIDLAGSEKATSHSDRRKEGAFINKSLLTLGTVISKLTEDRASSHIPYRDSKLTRMLQSSLSGNARIAVICTISPCHQSLEESQNTLKFASRVKKVVTAASTNQIMDDKALLQKYRNEINDLRVQLISNNEGFSRERETNLTLLQEKQKNNRNLQHEEQMMEMQLVRTALKERIDHLTKLILTSGSISAKNLGERPMPSLSTQTKASVDDNNDRELERLRRENTELQIVIDELRETIRAQRTELDGILAGHSEGDTSSPAHGQIDNYHEMIAKLEQQLQEISGEKSSLESVRDHLLATVEQLQQDFAKQKTENEQLTKEVQTLTESIKETQSVTPVDIDISQHREDAERTMRIMKEELVATKSHCATLEQQDHDNKLHIQNLISELDDLKLQKDMLPASVLPNHSLDRHGDSTDMKNHNIINANGNTEKSTKKDILSENDFPKDLSELSDDELNQTNKKLMKSTDTNNIQNTQELTVSEQPPPIYMFTLG
ncbi:hypothetical protein INT43_005350 [Umbelopsis isabellina]|uniref:Kinesin motor domain-containing protein n=1 Tax=Mortierella isabellina TaxID=91625 RepID=A0A8H7PL95_MORIS|nr:hypothetical protein INT43_005350 [Umbelopsis isabellina]